MKKEKRRGVACQRKKEENQKECLPEDMIFEILTRLPAEFLHNYGKKVCQEWADLINNPIFIESHYSRSQTELLFKKDYNAILILEVNKGKAILKQKTLDFSGILMSSCHGITLFHLMEENFCLCIANIVTKQIIKLPLAPIHSKPWYPIVAAIGYDFLHGEFKVICFYKAKGKSYYWLFFTVGKDESWRKVDLAPSQISIESFNERTWISGNGVIYGVRRGSENFENIIVVDVGDETTWVVDGPDYKEEMNQGSFVENNKLINIAHGKKESMISVYQLDKFRHSSWVKIYKFQLHPMANGLIYRDYYSSLALADNGEVLIFQSDLSQEIGIYNVRTGRCKMLLKIPWAEPFIAISQSLVFL